MEVIREDRVVQLDARRAIRLARERSFLAGFFCGVGCVLATCLAMGFAVFLLMKLGV
jgi:hypothetical protein